MSRLYDRTFALAFAGQAIFALSNLLMVQYARWIAFLDGDVREVGWIMGFGAVAGLVLRPWMGQCTDRLGARTSWVLGYVIFVAGSLGSLFLHDLSWSIYVCRGCLVVGPALIFLTTITFVTQTSPDGRRAEALGTMGVSGLIAMMLGPYLGDIALGLGGEERTRDDFVLLFVAAAAIVTVPLTIVFFLRPPRLNDENSRARSVSLRDFVKLSRRHWPGGVLFLAAIQGLYMSIPFAFLPDYVDRVGLSIPGTSEVGLFFLVYAGLALILRILLRRVPDRIGRRRVLLVGVSFCGASALSFLVVDPRQPWLLLVPGLVGGIGHALTFPPMVALALEKFPREARGTGTGLTFMVHDLGFVCGAPLLGGIASTFGYSGLFLTVGAACFIAVAAYGWSCLPVWRARSKVSSASVAP